MTAVTADNNIIVVGLAFTQRPRHEVTRVGHMLFDETVRVSGQEKRMSERGRERERRRKQGRDCKQQAKTVSG